VNVPAEVLEVCQRAPLPDVPLDGSMLTGSFSVGLANAQSDIDILAISPLAVSWRKYYQAGSYDVDLYLISARRALTAIAAREQPLLQMIAKGLILDDRSGAVRDIFQRAQEQLRKGPAPPDPSLIRALRHRVVTVVDDCHSCRTDSESAVVLMICSELKNLSDLYLNTIGEWNVAMKHITRVVAGTNPRLAGCFAAASSVDRSVSERLTAFDEIVETVLRPYGGPLRYFETKRPASRAI
jgi:hypothetical protein